MNNKQRLIDLAPKALELTIIGMVQDPEDSDSICNADSVDLKPTSWDIFMKVPLTGEDWDGEDCSFPTYEEAVIFGEMLETHTPDNVSLQV